MAERLLKEAAKLEMDRADAALRKENFILRAIASGADRRDPWHTICVIDAWGHRPVVKGNKLMVRIPATQSNGPMFVQVGEIYFSPLGGIRGLRVVDTVGDVMICDGDCAGRAGRWSHLVRGSGSSTRRASYEREIRSAHVLPHCGGSHDVRAATAVEVTKAHICVPSGLEDLAWQRSTHYG